MTDCILSSVNLTVIKLTDDYLQFYIILFKIPTKPLFNITLGHIGGVQTAVYCWRTPASAERGAQIDLLIDRADHCVNLCELKFSIGEYVMSKSEREKIQNRMDSFIIHTKTKKSIRVTLITSFGCRRNVNSGIVVNQLTIADLL